MDNTPPSHGGKARPSAQRRRPLLARESVKPGRPRQLNANIPAHIDQAKLPSGVYFDHRWAKGTWYTLTRVDGKSRRQNILPSTASLAELHKKVEELRACDTTGTIDWLCGLFEASDKFRTLAAGTQEDYRYCRGILSREKDRKGGALGAWPIKAFDSTVIQRVIDRIGATFPTKANHLLRYLRRLFRWGGNRGYCAKVNPAEKIEPAAERKQRTIPTRDVMRDAIIYARECGSLAARTKGAHPPYLWAVAEIAYQCRLRGIEVVTLTDAHASSEGIMTNRRKGSRDNITEWSPSLRLAWDSLIDRRARVWTKRQIPTPIQPHDRPLVVSEDGTPLERRVLGNAWKRLMKAAVEAGRVPDDAKFGMHALKRRGITDTKGTKGEKQLASGHKSASMVDVYDFSVPVVKPAGE